MFCDHKTGIDRAVGHPRERGPGSGEKIVSPRPIFAHAEVVFNQKTAEVVAGPLNPGPVRAVGGPQRSELPVVDRKTY